MLRLNIIIAAGTPMLPRYYHHHHHNNNVNAKDELLDDAHYYCIQKPAV